MSTLSVAHIKTMPLVVVSAHINLPFSVPHKPVGTMVVNKGPPAQNLWVTAPPILQLVWAFSVGIQCGRLIASELKYFDKYI